MLGDFLLNNLSTVAVVVLFIAAAFLSGKRRAYFEWANETLFLAFDNAEKRGLIDDIPGSDKLRHYLNIWRNAYRERFGKDPDEKKIAFAIERAADLAQKEKSVRAVVESLSNPK